MYTRYRFTSFNMLPEHFQNNSAHCAGLGLTIKGSHTTPVQVLPPRGV